MFIWHRGKSVWFFRCFGFGLWFKDLRRDDYLTFSQRTGRHRVWRCGPYVMQVLRRRELQRKGR